MALLKPCRFVGSSLDDLRAFPEPVRQRVGMALYEAQRGFESASAKVLKGFGGRSVLELVQDHDGDTWRIVYTVRFRGSIYVLHAFKKKAKRGAATPKQHIALIRRRLALAEEDHRRRTKEEPKP